MTDPAASPDARPAGSGGRPRPGAPTADRAAGWVALSDALAGRGRRDRALVAARTALLLLDSSGAPEDQLAALRRRVEELTGPDVVPLHVDMGGGSDGPPVSAAEVRAGWVGAPADPVMAMLGWVERDGALQVVRVVVPGTRRGSRAFTLLLGALPTEVAVEVVLPARDPALQKAARRSGFGLVDGSVSARGHVGGSLRMARAGGAR